MENKLIKLMRVSLGPGFHRGNYFASSFEEFHLKNLRADLNPFVDMFSDEKFTDVYFMTTSGNIYRIYQDEALLRSHNWVMKNIYKPELIYTFTDLEMLKKKLKLNERFIFGCHHSDELLEIICVNKNKTRLNISRLPEALIVGDFEMATHDLRGYVNRYIF